jgi:hypothetical protein
MGLVSKVERMEQALAACDDYESQCPHCPHFLGEALPCPEAGCRDGCRRAREIIIARLDLIESRDWREN